MSTPAAGIAAVQARLQLDAEHARRRNGEANCALDFLVFGDDEERGPHAGRCICLPPCSRDYDPMPYVEAEPEPGLHEGTSIGALYGLSPMTAAMAADLAGWNLKPRSVYE